MLFVILFFRVLLSFVGNFSPSFNPGDVIEPLLYISVAYIAFLWAYIPTYNSSKHIQRVHYGTLYMPQVGFNPPLALDQNLLNEKLMP